MRHASLPLLLLLVLGLTVWWLWTTRPQPVPEPPIPTPVTESRATVASPAVVGPPPGYRLAGLAVGHPTSFAAIELPDGNSHLYRLNSNVPGLGRIVAITETGATIEGEQGRFTLHLQPAATATPERRLRRGEMPAEPTPEPQSPADHDDTTLAPDA